MLASNYVAPLGPQVDAFEREFAEYVGIKHCVALSSGTDVRRARAKDGGQKSEDGSRRTEDAPVKCASLVTDVNFTG